MRLGNNGDLVAEFSHDISGILIESVKCSEGLHEKLSDESLLTIHLEELPLRREVVGISPDVIKVLAAVSESEGSKVDLAEMCSSISWDGGGHAGVWVEVDEISDIESIIDAVLFVETEVSSSVVTLIFDVITDQGSQSDEFDRTEKPVDILIGFEILHISTETFSCED